MQRQFGTGGIGIVRIPGPDALVRLKECALSERREGFSLAGYTRAYGLAADQRTIDEVISRPAFSWP